MKQPIMECKSKRLTWDFCQVIVKLSGSLLFGTLRMNHAMHLQYYSRFAAQMTNAELVPSVLPGLSVHLLKPFSLHLILSLKILVMSCLTYI